MFTKVSIGDKVWDVGQGWGEVRQRKTDYFTVKFTTVYGDYSFSDYLYSGQYKMNPKRQVLFFNEMDVIISSTHSEIKNKIKVYKILFSCNDNKAHISANYYKDLISHTKYVKRISRETVQSLMLIPDSCIEVSEDQVIEGVFLLN